MIYHWKREMSRLSKSQNCSKLSQNQLTSSACIFCFYKTSHAIQSNTLENSFFQISSYLSAYLINHEKTKDQFPIFLLVRPEFTSFFFHIKHSMTGPEGNKINSFPRDQPLSDLLYSWKFWSLKFITPRFTGGLPSTFLGNSALLLYDVIDFTMLPTQRFWREIVSLLDVVWPRSNQWVRALWGKTVQLYNNLTY